MTSEGYNVRLLVLGRIHVVLHGLIEFTSVTLDSSPNLGTVNYNLEDGSVSEKTS